MGSLMGSHGIPWDAPDILECSHLSWGLPWNIPMGYTVYHGKSPCNPMGHPMGYSMALLLYVFHGNPVLLPMDIERPI